DSARVVRRPSRKPLGHESGRSLHGEEARSADARGGNSDPGRLSLNQKEVPMSHCPSRELLQQFLAEQLNDAVQQALETHVETCAACQATLAALSDEGEEVNTQLFRSLAPAPLTPSEKDFVRQLQENPPCERKAFLPAEKNQVSPITFPGPPTEKGPLG